MYKKIISMLLITLLIASTAGGMGIALAEEGDPVPVTQEDADTWFGLVADSKGEVVSLFESITSGGEEVPSEATEAFDEAEALMGEAQTAYDAEDYETAVEKATDALNKYGDALERATPEEPDDDDDDDDETDDVLKTFAGYEKARERLEKLREIAGDLEGQGIDVSEVVAMLDEAALILDEMDTQLNLGDLDAAANMLGEANSLIGNSMGKLTSLSNSKKKEKIEQFIERTRERIIRLETKLNRILAKYGVSGEDSNAIVEEFNALRAILDGVDIDEDDLKDVIDQLKDVVKDSKKVGKDKEDLDEEVIEKVNDIADNEDKLNRYRERIGELAEQGVETGELSALLAQVEGLLAEAQAEVEAEAGNKEAAEEILEEAEDLLDDLDDMIDDMEEDEEDKGNKYKGNFEEEQAKLEEEIAELAEEIDALKSDGQDTTDLEARLDEARLALEEARTMDDLDEVEEILEELDELVEDDYSEEPEPEEPEEPESTG
jgi:DNA repair ATPase RecN